MKQLLFLVAVACLMPFKIRAQDTLAPKEYHFKEIVVTGIRTDWQIYETSRIREFIDDRLVGSVQQNQFVNMLNLATGIDIKDYGSSHSLKTLSIRGSSSEQVQILLNGVPLLSPASGAVDISLIPMDHVKLIEIDRGVGFSGQGNSAIGGTINLTTSPQYPLKKFYNEFLIALSSFDHRRFQWHNHWNIAGWQTSTSFTRDFQPDSSFQVNDPYSEKKVYRVHTQSGRTSLTHQVQKKINFFDLNLTNLYTYRNSQIPNTIENNRSILSDARQKDRLWIIQPQIRYKSSPTHDFRLTGSYQFTELDYRKKTGGIHSNIRTSYYYVNAESGQRWSSFYQTSAGFSAGYANGHGDMLLNADTKNHAAYINQTILIPVYFIRIFDRLSLYPSVRYDHYDQYKDAMTVHGGFVLGRYLDRTTYLLKGSAGNQHRVPTLNERFWNGDGGIGNPDIRPERSWALNSGLTVIHSTDRYGTIQSEVNAFYMRTHQKIIWEMGVLQQGMISPVNIRQSRSAGWEFLTTYAWDSLTCRVSFVRNLSEDISEAISRRIPYSPLYSIKFSAQWSTRRWMFFQSTRYNSERFVTLQNPRFLKRYLITDCTVQFRSSFIDSRIFIFANLNNIWDSEYEPVAMYPGPSRFFEIGIKIGI